MVVYWVVQHRGWQPLPGSGCALMARCSCLLAPLWRTRRSTPRHYTRALEVFWKRHVLRRNVLDSGCPCPNHVLHTRVAYRVARSMFETETLPPALAWFAHHVDEVRTCAVCAPHAVSGTHVRTH